MRAMARDVQFRRSAVPSRNGKVEGWRVRHGRSVVTWGVAQAKLRNAAQGHGSVQHSIGEAQPGVGKASQGVGIVK